MERVGRAWVCVRLWSVGVPVCVCLCPFCCSGGGCLPSGSVARLAWPSAGIRAGRRITDIPDELRPAQHTPHQLDASEGRQRWAQHQWPPQRPRPGGGEWPLAASTPALQPTAEAGGARLGWCDGRYKAPPPQPVARTSRRAPAAAPAGSGEAPSPLGLDTPHQLRQPGAMPLTAGPAAPTAARPGARQHRRLRSVGGEEPLSSGEGELAALDAEGDAPRPRPRRDASVSAESRPVPAREPAGARAGAGGRSEEGKGAAAVEAEAPPHRGARFKRRQQQEQQQEQQVHDGSGALAAADGGDAHVAAHSEEQAQRKRARRGPVAGRA